MMHIDVALTFKEYSGQVTAELLYDGTPVDVVVIDRRILEKHKGNSTICFNLGRPGETKSGHPKKGKK